MKLMTALKKTDTFFVISNYNTDPERYLEYCEDYIIYDQSPDQTLRGKLKSKYEKIACVENTGHNISDYFRFFVDHYENLPPWIMLAKGNMIGRHVSQGYFEKVYDNKRYTFLYNDEKPKDTCGVAYHLYEGAFLEINNSWYAFAKTHKYFTCFNDFLRFIFKDPVIPEWVLFSPGACYIVSKEQVLKYPKAFYRNLCGLVSYTYFPTEAYMVERALHMIFSANYTLTPWAADEKMFSEQLERAAAQNAASSMFITRVRRKLQSFRLRYQAFKIKNLKEWLKPGKVSLIQNI